MQCVPSHSYVEQANWQLQIASDQELLQITISYLITRWQVPSISVGGERENVK